jgi:hypothetical protein
VQPRDFDEEFDTAVEQWRKRFGVRESDAVMLLLELFRIHQDHWDGIRQRDTMGLLEFRQMMEKQNESIRVFKSRVDDVISGLRHWEDESKSKAVRDGITIFTIIVLIFGTGILIGKCLL